MAQFSEEEQNKFKRNGEVSLEEDLLLANLVHLGEPIDTYRAQYLSCPACKVRCLSVRWLGLALPSSSILLSLSFLRWERSFITRKLAWGNCSA